MQDATPDLNELKEIFGSQWSKVQKRLKAFLKQAPTPEGTWGFEIGVDKELHELGRLSPKVYRAYQRSHT